jgi:ribonuclease T1
MRRILLPLAALLGLLGLLLTGCGKHSSSDHAAPVAATSAAHAASSGTATVPKPGPRPTAAGTAPSAQVPARVTATLAKIDAGAWPPKGDSGTQGGRHFGNFEGRLPKTTTGGKRIQYTEWDVNAKQAGRGRDAERIITGDDGSAWYTLNHYQSFTRIR